VLVEWAGAHLCAGERGACLPVQHRQWDGNGWLCPPPPPSNPPPPAPPHPAGRCSIDDRWLVDATVVGGRARYINHACDFNCYTKPFLDGGVRKIGIFTSRRVRPGEELFYDYRVSGWVWEGRARAGGGGG